MSPSRRTPKSGRRAEPAVSTPVRCAIYTRKSTDEGLDQEFNSLDAQRESAENYIASQRGEGWSALPERFDDGGFSGGTTERPALQRLLALVEEGAIDVIVVYKLDRLSRSMLDFLQIHELAEAHGVGIVSVTQPINTSTSHGRMMVNILLSFAQFERELISERTRDKMSAARRRGRWTGGWVPLGYDVAPEGGALIVNPGEAERVRAIFELYAEHQSLRAVVAELNRRGWRTKSWTTRKGTHREGRAWTKSALQKLLRDPLYAGKQKLGHETFKGLHPAIVPRQLFGEVQKILDVNGRSSGGERKNRTGALLRGLLRCRSCDAPMAHDWTRKRAREYRYYRCSTAKQEGVAICPTHSLSAPLIEKLVVEKIRAIGRDPALQKAVIVEVTRLLRRKRTALKKELQPLRREAKSARESVSRLATAAAKAPETARAPLYEQLEAEQAQKEVLEGRKREVEKELQRLEQASMEEPGICSALAGFDEIWDALLIPERERVLQLLIENVLYDQDADEITIHFQPLGISMLASELGTAEEAS